jgi:DNA-binding beta-propeller fold protein YncE
VAAFSALGLLALPAVAAAATKPTYERTIGGRGHAEMYPSGLDVDPATGTVYVADTGNDEVKAYSSSGARLWSTGSRGARALGRFNNPRDVAFVGGRVYVADLGYNRVQVLDAKTGKALLAWPARFTSIIGISGGTAVVNGRRTPAILTSDDAQNVIGVHNLSGALIRRIAPPVGSGAGQLNAPRDAATDAAGNIFVADYANNRIARYSAAGAWLGSFGTRGSANGQFIRPYGVELDSAGRLYVADSNNNRIQKLTATGGFLAKWGGTGTGSGQFSQMRRVAVGAGATPDVYGVDLWGWKYVRFAHGGAVKQVIGGQAPPAGRFNEPSGVSVSGSQVYVADAVNQRIQRFATSGVHQMMWGQRGWGNRDKDGFNWPRDVEVNEATNTVWVADSKNDRLVQFTRDGAPTGTKLPVPPAGGAPPPSPVRWPYGIDSVGRDIMVADTFHNQVMRWNTATRAITWISRNACGMNFAFPYDVTVSGSVAYVADAQNRRVVKLNTATGACLGTFGQGTLRFPEGVALEAGTGEIWVADTSRNRLVEFSAAGAVLQTFGTPGTAHGQFNKPMHLDLSGGLLYVADMWNDRIEVFDTRG